MDQIELIKTKRIFPVVRQELCDSYQYDNNSEHLDKQIQLITIEQVEELASVGVKIPKVYEDIILCRDPFIPNCLIPLNELSRENVIKKKFDLYG